MKMIVNFRLEVPRELEHRDASCGQHHNQANKTSLGGQYWPGQHQQPRQEEGDDGKEDATKPGQVARLNQAKEQERGH